jgi:hypothetical protein
MFERTVLMLNGALTLWSGISQEVLGGSPEMAMHGDDATTIPVALTPCLRINLIHCAQRDGIERDNGMIAQDVYAVERPEVSIEALSDCRLNAAAEA